VLVRRPFVVLALAITWGCGDGVGNPILGDGLVAAGTGGSTAGAGAGGAGSGGTLASAGDAGSGSGAGGAPVAGASGGGTAGAAGRDRERPPPDGGGLKPPWEEGIGGTGGEPSGQAGWMNMPPPGGAPDPEECASASSSGWDPIADASEREFFDALNNTRLAGMRCGVPPGPPPQGPPVSPVAFNPALRCSARLHSRDMSDNGYFDDVNLQGVGPEDRMRQAGAMFRTGAETIARSYQPPGEIINPYEVFTGILTEGGSQCDNLMDARFVWVGIGVYRDFITLDFSGP
jgi:uncharacterized protein YkwD